VKHDGGPPRRSADERYRTFREGAFEEIRMGLEQDVVDGDDVGDEGEGRGYVL
jgi:hypothetical protein